MNKCRLCQEITNNLTIIYNNRLKSLTQIILKFKGFKGSGDTNNDLAVCEKCIKGVENVALFWENIPEAKKETADIPDDLKKQNTTTLYRMGQNLPALTLEVEEKNDFEPSCCAEEDVKPIKLRIKLPRNTKKRKLYDTNNTSIETEPLEKRTRRCPQRYSDFQLTGNQNTSAFTDVSTFKQNAKDCNEIYFTDLPQVALLRLKNSQNIGTLAEVESQGLACKIRISCEICCQIFRAERLFQKHLKTHFPTDLEQDNVTNYLYHCHLCDKPFTNHRTVRNHFKLAHSEERHFKCRLCEASFKYKFNFNYHMSTKHIDKKPFECTFCKKRFCMRYELKIHVRTHTKERPYKCELCSIAFAHKSNLKHHQRVKHSENSTQTTFLPDLNTSEKTSISAEEFAPPEYLIEKEEEYLGITDKNIVYSSSLKDSVISEEPALPSEELLLTETDLEQENVLQCGPLNIEQSVITSEQTSPPEAMLEQKKQSVLNDRNISSSPILTNFECFMGNLEENHETTTTKTMFAEEYSMNKNIQSDLTEQTNLRDNKILRIPTLNENTEGLLKTQPIMGVFQFDSSLLKILPSTSLLGLKKWTKSFQSAPINNLQLVKSSTFLRHENIAMNKNIENSSVSTNPFVNYRSLQQFTQIADNNTSSSLFEYPSNSNSSSLNLARNNSDISAAQDENISKLTKSLPNNREQNKLTDINNFKTYEVNSNNEAAKMPLEINASQLGKEIKISSSPVKVKYITNSNQFITASSNRTQAVNKNIVTKEISANQALTNLIASPNENVKPSLQLVNSTLKPFKMLSPVINQSLLKPVVKEPQATPLTFTSLSSNRTLLHNKPLITNIEILPPLKMLTTLQNSPTTTSFIKSPVEYKFQCPYCYKYFKQKSPLTKHLRTHTGEKPYKCNLCSKSYADASNYKKHKILHKNAAEALNISRKTTAYAVQSSPAYSTVSDPDPDGIEVMQTLKKFECSSTEDDDMDENDSDFSNMESQIWHDALDQALNSEDIKANIRINLMGINNAVLPKSRHNITNTTDLNKFSTEDLD